MILTIIQDTREQDPLIIRAALILLAVLVFAWVGIWLDWRQG
ncbi:MAG: hypothetical protein ABIH23_08315 [bacterium]